MFSAPTPRRLAMCAALVLATTVGACADGEPTTTSIASALALQPADVTEPAAGPWSRVVNGANGTGAQYALYIPRTWNGSAVFYAHGFRDVDSPIDLRDQDSLYAFRDRLGDEGYAVAYSSYSRNGFAVKDGAQWTHQLRGLLAAELRGQPERSYLVGASLGAGIALQLAQQFGRQYDGALLMCGMVGGSIPQTQYLGHVRALADVYFPGAFPGNVTGVPAGTVISLPQVIGAVQANPAGLFAIGSMQQSRLPYVPVGAPTNPATPAFQTLAGSLYAALSFHARGINDIVDLTQGGSPFDNSTTTYALASTPLLPPAMLAPAVAAANAMVTRYEFGAGAEGYLERHFTSTGDLSAPTITIHNAWDPAVPMFHEDTLRARAQAAGRSANLVQRVVPSYGHCAIPVTVALQGLRDLAAWQTSGVRPAN